MLLYLDSLEYIERALVWLHSYYIGYIQVNLVAKRAKYTSARVQGYRGIYIVRAKMIPEHAKNKGL